MKLNALPARTRIYLVVAFGKTLAYIACLYFFVDGLGSHARAVHAEADKGCHPSVLEFFK